ncbi:hypothetical protein A8990_118111 [Paenibacillus taihuensis]|uniref:Uncharacterized protein n=1 Tax=Paenibacillus taihuensis TaxID=1156355 RepID=A0A3D9RY47_9BACL|nr:hypothetical protein [Paenibacillus taihuensis]REE81585.1 hypothetical protein A8990_118111 [Paenibacillus taihuensis]
MIEDGIFEKIFSYDNQKVLFESKVLDSLQFLKNSGKKLQLAELEVKALNYVNQKSRENYSDWNKDLFANGKTNALPITVLEYFGTTLMDDDAIEKIVGSFFHYLHSFYDSYAQFINSTLLMLSKKVLDINHSSFFQVRERLKGITEFQPIYDNLEQVAQTMEYKYIDDFNNINKHQFTLELQSTLVLNDGTIEQEIPSFSKKDRQHGADEMTKRLDSSFKMSLMMFQTVTDLVMDYLKNNVTDQPQNRYHTISIKEQSGFGNSGDGAAIFITIDDLREISEGDSFFVLLAKEDDTDRKIRVENILTDNLMLQNINGKKLGFLKAQAPVNPNILMYREYRVVLTTEIEKAYVLHFFEPKTVQFGYGDNETIFKLNNQEEIKSDDVESTDPDEE